MNIFVAMLEDRTTTLMVEEIYNGQRYKMVWRLSMAFTVIFAVLSVLFYNIEPIGFTIYTSVFLLSLFSLVWLTRSDNYKVVFWIFTISASASVIISTNIIIDTLHYSDIIWIVNIILFAYIGLSKKEALFFVLLHATALGYYLIFQMNDHIAGLSIRTNVQIIVTTVEVLFSFFVMAYLFHTNLKFQQFVQVELKSANKELEEKNLEITTLLKEVHHRVKNNLQIVISLLRIQQSELNSEELKNQFQEAVNRIMTISSIHQKLYQSKELSQLDFKDYIDSLIMDFKNLFLHRVVKIQSESSIEKVDLKAVVPIGLILNELITNSIKHSEQSNQEIVISMNFVDEQNGFARLIYNDENTWNSDSTGFGLELIRIMVDQLDGEMIRNGSHISITFRSDF